MKTPKQIFEEATEQRTAILEKWKDNLAPIAEAYQQERGHSIPSYLLENTAIILENMEDEVNRRRGLNETTYSDAVSFVNYGFRVISALMPTLISNEIVSVQPMDRRTGQIFFLKYIAGVTKGKVTAGDLLIGPKTGAQGLQKYSSDEIEDEPIAEGNGSLQTFTGTLAYKPVIAEGLTIQGIEASDTETLTDDGAGLLVSDHSGGSGTINYTTGAYSVTFAITPDNGVNIIAGYRFNLEKDPTGIGQVDIDLSTSTVTARTRKLKARWLLDAAYDLQKAHGISAESELLVAITSEVKHEIDVEICSDLLTVAKSGLSSGQITFDGRLPTVGSSGTVFPWMWQKEGLLRTLAEGAQKIFQSTKRAVGNYVVCGTQVAALLSTLEDFKSARDLSVQPPSGPYKIGTVKGLYSVYVNPFFPTNEFLLGFRGTSFLNAGYVYAPYLPIFVSPTIVLDDFVYRRGIATAYGKKVINEKFYVGGEITNL